MGAPTDELKPHSMSQNPTTAAAASGTSRPSGGSGLKKLFGRRNSRGSGNTNHAGGTSLLHANEQLGQIVRITNQDAPAVVYDERNANAKSLSNSRNARANKNKNTTPSATNASHTPSPSNNNNITTTTGSRIKKRLSLRGLLPKNNKNEVHTDEADSSSDRNSPLVDQAAQASPNRQHLFQWQDNKEKEDEFAALQKKQHNKERDGFCRRVDAYDGQVITVDGKPVYELGNYLGGGVAGVVYEGHRLRPMEEYPVRLGINDDEVDAAAALAVPPVVGGHPVDLIGVKSLLCGPGACGIGGATLDETTLQQETMNNREPSLLTVDTSRTGSTGGGGPGSVQKSQPTRVHTEEIALEATESGDRVVIIDAVDAPSRSKHYAQAVSSMTADAAAAADFPDDASIRYGFMEETVAIKILNPVGFRTLSPSVTVTAVVAREGVHMDVDVQAGRKPMEERHVWWLINPNSRNLRTLQRYAPAATAGRRIDVDRGSREKGLRISLVAAYREPKTGQLLELPLTKCIEIWGHVTFGATDQEFNDIMEAIDRVNAGQPPPPLPAFSQTGGPPVRIGTGGTSSTGSLSNGMDDMGISSPVAMSSKRTGIYRAACSDRTTVYCEELSAYIALPAVASKYLKWLRQRRAATKEIRNMMLIGRHRNVVHLFEVLEHIQDTKSTMFLILELVRGGELFDLISSNAAKISSDDKIPPGFTESETVMRKFFSELASGIHYCHSNSIAHRDLKPENLLVHNSTTGKCTLKIADFGLSAAFGPQSQTQTDQDTVVESVAPGALSSAPLRGDDYSLADTPPKPSPIKQSVDKIIASGSRTLSFLTCGAVVDIIDCGPRSGDDENGPSPLKRMTSVVGSPHYVAPEIISQTDRSKGRDLDGALIGYDGTKADVWSAGVILYAMLYRSLPFGEDLLRCPRYQSFHKWYAEVKKMGGRRSSAMAALNPIITETDEREYLGPHWFFPSESSPESRDLIVCMLNPDPDKRPTIQLVLQHPWILKQAT